MTFSMLPRTRAATRPNISRSAGFPGTPADAPSSVLAAPSCTEVTLASFFSVARSPRGGAPGDLQRWTFPQVVPPVVLSVNLIGECPVTAPPRRRGHQRSNPASPRVNGPVPGVRSRRAGCPDRPGAPLAQAEAYRSSARSGAELGGPRQTAGGPRQTAGGPWQTAGGAGGGVV